MNLDFDLFSEVKKSDFKFTKSQFKMYTIGKENILKISSPIKKDI
jgi:hypothetical protein